MKDYRLIHITKWKIVGFDHYGILENKRIFNYKTNRFSKKVVINYSTGLNLDGKFYTIKTLKENKWIVPVEKLSQNNKRSQVIELNDLITLLAS